MLHTVAVLLTEPVALFELGLVSGVFGVDRSDEGIPAFTFLLCSTTPGQPMATSCGGWLIAPDPVSAAAEADLVVIPGGGRDGTPNEPILEELRAAVRRGALVLSICTGAFVLAAAGLLDGRVCTTHWRHTQELAERHPLARVDPDVLFTVDGPVWTSGGSAAGMDACLQVVRSKLGAAVAARIARRMVVSPQRDGGQRQFVEAPLPQDHAESLDQVLEWMRENLDVDHSNAQLAARANLTERTFARRFVAEVGTSPHRWLTTQRILQARKLLEDTDLSIEDIARSCGFTSPALLRHHFRHIVGLAPGDYRKRFA